MSLYPGIGGNLATELLLCIARVCRFTYLVGQRKPDDESFLPIDVYRNAYIEASMDPFVNPWDSAGVSGDAYVMRYNGLDFAVMSMEKLIEIEPLFRVGQFS